MELTDLWLELWFWEKEEHPSGEPFPEGSLMHGKQFKHVGGAREVGKVGKKTPDKSCHLPQNTGLSSFWTISNVLCSKFCQRTVDRKCVDVCGGHLLSDACVKNKENTLPSGEISVKRHKKNIILINQKGIRSRNKRDFGRNSNRFSSEIKICFSVSNLLYLYICICFMCHSIFFSFIVQHSVSLFLYLFFCQSSPSVLRRASLTLCTAEQTRQSCCREELKASLCRCKWALTYTGPIRKYCVVALCRAEY